MKQKHTKYTWINANKSTNSEMDPVWQNRSKSTLMTILFRSATGRDLEFSWL